MVVRPIVCKRFIGRAEELAFLGERRHEAGRSRGAMIIVKGEAGVGKSRLMSEFAHSLAGTRWRVGFGRSLEFARRPYGPIVETLRRLDPTFTELAPAGSKPEQYDVIFGRLADAASRSAICLVIEDVHWADAATIEFLAYLGTRIPTLRILVLASLRPEEAHAEHPLYAHLAKLLGTPKAATLALQPFTENEQRAFIDEAVGDLEMSTAVRRSVARTADGNAFFIEELLKSAIEGSRSLPTTVHGAIMERLRPLTDVQRAVLTQAAVIGRRFDAATLRRTLSTEPADVETALQRARSLQLIEQEDGGVFRFRHALTREAIYDERLGVQLGPMHRTIAELLERDAPGGTALESLAYHWLQAGDAERGARYAELAGDAAGRVHAHADAVTLYERAAHALDDASPKRAALLEKIGHRHVVLAATDAAHDAFALAADIFAAGGEYEREAACRVQQALAAYSTERPDPIAPLEAMLERLARDDYRARSRVHLGIAWITASFGEPATAERHVDRVDPRAIAELPEIRLRVHNIRAWTAKTFGDVARFRSELDRWLEAAKGVNLPGALTSANFNGAYCATVLGLHDDAVRLAEAAVAMARAERNPYGERGGLGRLACDAIFRGDLKAARVALEPLAGMPRAEHTALAHEAAWGSLAGAYLDDATMIKRWFDDVFDAITPVAITLCGAGYAEILARRGRIVDARALLGRGFPAFGDLARGMLFTFVAIARYGAEREVADARRRLTAIASLPHETPERYVLPLFEAELARRHGDPAVMARHANDAVAGLRRLGLPLLEAAAHELAGDRDTALALYERCGAVYEVRRLRPHAVAAVGENRSHELLTERERSIALLVTAGKSNIEIGRALAISHKTVEKHLGRVYEKLGFSTRAQLGAFMSADGGHAAQ